MSQKLEKLKTLLKELFQLDQPDLDFGLYRIMHAKADEVSQFLDVDLLPQVGAAFASYQTSDKAELEKELAKAIEQAQGLGADPDSIPKVKELRARIDSDAVDISGLESEVYDHLYSFFRRYYSEGDFLAKRVYKEAMSHQEAVKTICNDSGTHFDPAIISAFKALQEEFQTIAAQLRDKE